MNGQIDIEGGEQLAQAELQEPNKLSAAFLGGEEDQRRSKVGRTLGLFFVMYSATVRYMRSSYNYI